MDIGRVNPANLLVLASSLCLLQCTDDQSQSTTDKGFEDIKADYVIFGLTDYLTRDGVREALVEADTCLLYTSPSPRD